MANLVSMWRTLPRLHHLCNRHQIGTLSRNINISAVFQQSVALDPNSNSNRKVEKKSDPTYMDEVDMDERMPNLSAHHQYYVRRATREAKERATDAKEKQFSARIVGSSLLSLTIVIYFYTIYVMKKEGTMKEFDEVPPKRDYIEPQIPEIPKPVM